MTNHPDIPNVEDLKKQPSSPPARYGVKETNRWSAWYHGKWKLDRHGAESATIDVIVEVIPLADVPPGERPAVVAELMERAKKLAGRPMPYVVPPLAAGPLPNGDYYSVRSGDLEEITPHENEGVPEAKGEKLEALGEQLLTGLAALHAADITYGDLRIEDVRKSKCRGAPTLWLSGAEFGELSTITGNVIERQSTDGAADSNVAGKDKRGDLYRAGLVLCQLAGGSKSQKLRNGSKALLKLVANCLSDKETDRPSDACAALQKLADYREQEERSKRNFLLYFSIAAVVTALVFGGLWWESKRREAEAIAKRDAAIQAAKDSQAAKEQVEAELAQLKGDGPPPNVHEEASKLFNKYYGQNDAISMPLNDWLDAELDGRDAEEVVAIKQAINVFRNALQRAETYKLRLESAATNNSSHQNKDANWLLTVYVNGEQVDREMFHPGKYSPQNYPVLDIPWKPKQSIQLLVEGDWGWYYPNRDNLVIATYSGEYALWQLHRELQSLSRDGTTIRGRILKCPGPDRTYFKPVTPPPKTPQPAAPATNPSGNAAK